MKNRYFRKRNRKKPFLFMTLLAILVIYTIYIADRNLMPTIEAMSEIKARLLATQAINDIAYTKITEDEYKNIVTVMTDKDGRITLVKADSMLMNKLAGETTLAIQQKLAEIETTNLRIPIANIFGSPIFANTGPSINVKIQPIGAVKVDFRPETETSGINMTRLKIYLFVETNIRIIAPFIRNDVEVATHVPISETIIVSNASNLKHTSKSNIFTFCS